MHRQVIRYAIILAGIAGSQLFNALTAFIITKSANAEEARGIMFWLLGSLSGTVPGIDLPNVHLPLNRDRFFQLTWTAAGGPLLPGSVGVLDGDGRATPWLVLPTQAWGVLLGRQFDFCTLLGTPFQETTAGVRFVVVP